MFRTWDDIEPLTTKYSNAEIVAYRTMLSTEEKKNDSSKQNKEEKTVEGTLVLLQELWKEKETSLEMREKELQKAIEAFEKEKKIFGASSSEGKTENDVLYLNIGGTVVNVRRSTLTWVEDSMLTSLFSGRWDESIEKDRDGNFFIDQPTELFLPLINYFRAKACETPAGPPVRCPTTKDFNGSYDTYTDFVRMVEYYGVTPGVYPCVLEVHQGRPESCEITDYPQLGATVKEWSVLKLVTLGHGRRVRSFEVKLGDVENVQVGWLEPRNWSANQKQSATLKVGSAVESICLDLCTSGFQTAGDFSQVSPSLSIVKGDIIRCEKVGRTYRWFLNDIAIPYKGNIASISSDYDSSRIPAISSKGQWSITKFVLDP